MMVLRGCRAGAASWAPGVSCCGLRVGAAIGRYTDGEQTLALGFLPSQPPAHGLVRSAENPEGGVTVTSTFRRITIPCKGFL